MEAEEVWRLRSEEKPKERRSYDRRPATVNLDQPTRLVTTRNAPTQSGRFPAGLIAGATLAAVGLLSIGLLLGLMLRPVAAPEPSLANATPELTNTTVEQSASTQGQTGSEGLAADPTDSVDDGVSNDGGDSAQIASASPAEGAHGENTHGDASATDHAGEPRPAVLGANVASAQSTQLEEALTTFDAGRISFVRGTNQLTPVGQEAASTLAALLMTTPDAPVEIIVRTFSETTPGLNHGLSIQQADVLVEHLVQHGLDRERVGAAGIGSSGSDAPSVAAAIKFDAVDAQQAELAASHGPLVLNDPFSGTFAPETMTYLSSLGDSLAARPETELQLVGYAWHHETQDQNHEASHHILDAAFEEMQARGAEPDQVSLVGLGGVDTTLTDQPTEVVVQAGTTAAVGLSLGDIRLDAVAFAPSTAELSELGSQTLTDVAQIMKLDTSLRVEVAVHSYSESNSQLNHDLSRRQADTIFTYLITEGVAPSQLDILWHGDPDHFAAPGRLGAVTFAVLQ